MRRSHTQALDSLLGRLARCGQATRAEPQAVPCAAIERHVALATARSPHAPAGVRLSHRGQFNLSSDHAAWRPFESRQWMTTRRPGFVWSARIGTSPLPIDVIDAYVDGAGLLDARLWGVLPLSHAQGTREMARGELMRWLAEAVYAPWALLACPGLRWQAVDARHADATLVDSPTAATLRFEFGDDGLVSAVRAEARPRMRGRTTGETPWIGRWSDYARRDGVLVPTRGEVEWIVDGRARPYWRAELLACERLEALEPA